MTGVASDEGDVGQAMTKRDRFWSELGYDLIWKANVSESMLGGDPLDFLRRTHGATVMTSAKIITSRVMNRIRMNPDATAAEYRSLALRTEHQVFKHTLQ